MTRFQIKTCGITRARDAELAASLGADMIGMIFYARSPRAITLARAKEICGALPATVDRVGVFVDEKVGRILMLSEQLSLDYAQLHGRETARDIASLHRHGVKVIKSFGILSKADWGRVAQTTAELALVDAMTTTQFGGTGTAFDWKLRPAKRISNLVLAGGISEHNVIEGLKLFRPLVIDINSSVESRPGVKSAQKMKRFFEVCNSVRYGRETI